VAPLFPTYLFVPFDMDDAAWRTIASVRGVKRILGADPLRPIALRDGALDDLKTRYAAGEFVKPEGPTIRAGDRTLIRSGPFQGRIGICTESRGERIKVLLSVLGGDAPISVPVHIVERVAQ
jgi:transcription antitermination factor NusG